MSIVSPTKFAEVDLAPLELWGRSATRVCLGESLARVQLDAIFGESPARGRSGMRISRASSSRARFTVASVWANTEPALGGKSGWRPQVWRVVQVGDAQRGKAERPARVSHVLQVEATGERGLSSAMSTLRPYGSWPRSTITITPHHHGPVRQRLAEVADGEMFVDEADVDGT